MGPKATLPPSPVNDDSGCEPIEVAAADDATACIHTAEEGTDEKRSEGDGNAANADADKPFPEAPSSVLACAITGNRSEFLRALAGCMADNEAALRAIEEAVEGQLGEAAAIDHVARSLTHRTAPSSAAEAAAALAARIMARTMALGADGHDLAAIETLLSAGRDAALKLDKAHGPGGVVLLLQLASRLARKAAERNEPIGEVADALSGVAGRIANDPALARALAKVSPANQHRTRRGLSGPPRRIVLHGPVEIAIHPR